MECIARVAIIGSHVPRQCGIGTFTADLTEALSTRYSSLDCFALAMNDKAEGYDYPAQVRYEIRANDLASYRRASDFLNNSNIDLVCLQHEYGIFGGEAGRDILALLQNLRMPIVTTLHTILREPDASQCAVMAELTQLSDRLVVMSQRGAQFLRDVHGVDNARIDVIHHGIPNLPPVGAEPYKTQLDVTGKSVILTFGLLSPDKGIEHVIQAMPAILERFPDTVYVVLGATHPHVRQQSGEVYREALQALALRLGVSEQVIFHNRFVSQEELTRFLRAADIYVTPYLKPEQITSGTLAYAVGSGKAVISTPYYYAEELLAGGRGILVPWRDSEAIAQEVIELLAEPEKCAALQQRAAQFGQEMVWPAVADQYMATFQRAQLEYVQRSCKAVVSGTPDKMSPHSLAGRGDESKDGRWNTVFSSALKLPEISLAELPALNLAHLRLMTDDTGMLQHATYNVPNYDEGYCVDDNARALLLVTLLEEMEAKKDRDIGTLAARYLAFVQHALNDDRGRFRNFLSYDRRWLEEQGSEDSHGRALWATGTVVGHTNDSGRRRLGVHLFRRALPVVAEFTSPRAWAYTLLGLEEYLGSFPDHSEAGNMGDLLANRLLALFQANRSRDWLWFENCVTYCNARLPQALLVSGRRMNREDMMTAGLESLEWLCTLQRSEEGDFMPVGSNGFFLRGKAPARFDQQSVEACGMVGACLEAWRLTGEKSWFHEAQRAFNWFLGHNQTQQPLYDPITGGCFDGLHPDRVNENQGAEATLSFLHSLLEMRLADGRQGTGIASWRPMFPGSRNEALVTTNPVQGRP